MDKKKAHARCQAHCQVAQKSPPHKPKLVNKLSRPDPEKKSPAANKRSYCIPQLVVNMKLRCINLIYL